MEKGVHIDDAKLHPCSCKSPLCAHCSLHKALLRESLNELGIRIGEAGDEDSDGLLHPQSIHLVDGAQSGATRKLKLPCRRNSRSFSSSLASPPHDRLSWPPLPLARASSVDSVAYADACTDLQKSEKKLDPSMLTIACSSFEDEQEIMSTHPLLLEQQFTSPKKSTKPVSSPQGSANPRRTCRYCHREFPSGRALGGHMRVHGGLDVDRFPPTTNHTKREEQQFDGAVMHRSSSPVENSRYEDRFAEVNCLVSGSKVVNSSGGGVFRRRINSEESMVRGIDERKSSATRGIDGGEERAVPFSRGGAEEENSLRKKEQLVKGMKDQSVIKKDAFTFKKEINTPAMQKSISNDADDLNENHANNDDDDGYDHLYSSKLMVLGNASEIAPQEINQGNMASECVVDEGNPPHKLRPNPRPSRRRLWTDREGTIIADNNKESSGSHHSLARRSSSPPTFRGVTERARPCSECGKVFWSWKALFGHMRCHPEREWRGIQRPDASSSELDNKQLRACKKLSSLSHVAGNAELETELESDAENREEYKPTHATLSVSVSAKEEGFNTNEDVEEIELIKGRGNIKEADGLQNAEECTMKGGTKRGLKSTLFEESADDDLTPSAWPTRKRSRRSRATVAAGVKVTSTTSAEPALTSETATSSELRDHEKVSIKDQEDLDMANCLVLLSSAGNKVKDSEKHYMDSTQESALRKRGSAAANFGHSRHVNAVSCKDVGGDDDGANDGLNDDGDDENEAENFAALSKRPNAGGAMKYECSTCKRCFKSHQALGGHRASHRKTKGCFALMNEHAEETMQESKEDNIAEVDEFISAELNQWQAMGHILSVAPPSHHQQDEEKSPFTLLPSTIERSPTTFGKKKKFKGHACSICHRIFPSGQALGGHKRCHWTGEKIAESGSMQASSSNNNKAFLQEQDEWGGDGNARAKVHQAKRGKEDGIDLNLPAPLDEEDEAGYDNAGLSSTDAMDPEMQNDVEDAELDGEEDMEGHLVDYIGGKKRSLNGLSGEWAAEGGRRQEAAW